MDLPAEEKFDVSLDGVQNTSALKRIRMQMDELNRKIAELTARKTAADQEIEKLQRIIDNDLTFMLSYMQKRERRLELQRTRKVLNVCLAFSLPSACLAFYFRPRPIAMSILPLTICAGLGSFVCYLKHVWDSYNDQKLKTIKIPEDILRGTKMYAFYSEEMEDTVEDPLVNGDRKTSTNGREIDAVQAIGNEPEETSRMRLNSV